MNERLAEIEQIREEKYQPLKTRILEKAEEIIQTPAEGWWFKTMLLLKRTEKSLKEGEGEYPSEISGFLSENLKPTIDTLSKEVETDGETTKRAHDVIFELSKCFTEPDVEKEELTIHQVSLDTIVSQLDRVSYESWKEDKQRKAIAIQDKFGKKHLFPLPDNPEIVHKGGFPRVLLKIFVGAPEEIIEPELPPNDFDIIAINGVENIRRKVEEMEIDPDGVEFVERADWQTIFQQRDLDLNGCVVGHQSLIYSDEAKSAAKSGQIEIKEAKRGIYGTEHFYYDGQRLLKNRGMMRLIKTVAEGKALKFEFTPLNEKVDLGIYWLILTRKYMSKPKKNQLFERTFYLGQQMGQVKAGENNFIDVLDRVHTEYPFFDLEGKPLDEEGVVRWLGKKFIKQVDSYYRHCLRIPNDLILERCENDTKPYVVNMADFQPSQTELNKKEFDRFLARCRKRRQEFLDNLRFCNP